MRTQCRDDAPPIAKDPTLLVLNGIRDDQETQERQEELQTGWSDIQIFLPVSTASVSLTSVNNQLCLGCSGLS